MKESFNLMVYVERSSDAFIKTTESGNFYIRGFKNTGTIKISIFHDDFQWIEVQKELRKGIMLLQPIIV